MEYVFSCFRDRKDACLLWRPHPLFESSLDSMRMEFRPAYDLLKNYFMKYNLGVYDGTPDITNTIALCDAYLGDAATSVTSLFGIAGKPLFILDNNINTIPEENDWRERQFQDSASPGITTGSSHRGTSFTTLPPVITNTVTSVICPILRTGIIIRR